MGSAARRSEPFAIVVCGRSLSTVVFAISIAPSNARRQTRVLAKYRRHFIACQLFLGSNTRYCSRLCDSNHMILYVHPQTGFAVFRTIDSERNECCGLACIPKTAAIRTEGTLLSCTVGQWIAVATDRRADSPLNR